MSSTTEPVAIGTAAERRFFQMMYDRFQVRLRDTVAEVRSEEPDDRDWKRVEEQFLVYGMWLENEPAALFHNPVGKAVAKGVKRV